MANEQNLRPSEYKLSQEEAKKGGLASAEVRRRKRDLRKALEVLLEGEVVDKLSGKAMSGAEAISTKLFQRALRGDVKAFKTIRETVGQNPVQKIEMAQVDPDVVAEVEDMVYGDES